MTLFGSNVHDKQKHATEVFQFFVFLMKTYVFILKGQTT